MSRAAMLMLLGSALGAHAAVVVPPQAELKSVADRLHSMVIPIRAQAVVQLGDGGTVEAANFGTGVLIGDGLAVTTLHTLATIEGGTLHASTRIEALLPDAGALSADILAWFPELDLAILHLQGAPARTAPPLASELPAKGEPLVAMGVDEDAVTVVGVTVAAASADQLLLSSARRVDSRFWGGPIFDAHGQLVGISIPSLTQPKALSSVAFRNLLEEARGRDKTAAKPTP